MIDTRKYISDDGYLFYSEASMDGYYQARAILKDATERENGRIALEMEHVHPDDRNRRYAAFLEERRQYLKPINDLMMHFLQVAMPVVVLTKEDYERLTGYNNLTINTPSSEEIDDLMGVKPLERKP